MLAIIIYSGLPICWYSKRGRPATALDCLKEDVRLEVEDLKTAMVDL